MLLLNRKITSQRRLVLSFRTEKLKSLILRNQNEFIPKKDNVLRQVNDLKKECSTLQRRLLQTLKNLFQLTSDSILGLQFPCSLDFSGSTVLILVVEFDEINAALGYIVLFIILMQKYLLIQGPFKFYFRGSESSVMFGLKQKSFCDSKSSSKQTSIQDAITGSKLLPVFICFADNGGIDSFAIGFAMLVNTVLCLCSNLGVQVPVENTSQVLDCLIRCCDSCTRTKDRPLLLLNDVFQMLKGTIQDSAFQHGFFFVKQNSREEFLFEEPVFVEPRSRRRSLLNRSASSSPVLLASREVISSIWDWGKRIVRGGSLQNISPPNRN